MIFVFHFIQVIPRVILFYPSAFIILREMFRDDFIDARNAEKSRKTTSKIF